MLLNGLAHLATNLLARVANAFALVRFRRIKATDVRSHLTNQFLIHTLDRYLGVIRYRDFDVFRNRKWNRMRETEAQVKRGSLDGRLEPNSFNLELLGETLAY